MDRDATRGDQNGQAGEVNPRRSPAKEAYWRKAVADQRRSGQTVRAFCQDRRLTEPSFYAWRSELARHDAGQPADSEKWMFERFTAAGIAIAGIDVGESYGSPSGRAKYTALYRTLVDKRGMSRNPCCWGEAVAG